MTIHILKSKNNQWYFTMNARNGQVIATSETYKTHAGCTNGINAIVWDLKNDACKIIDHTKTTAL